MIKTKISAIVLGAALLGGGVAQARNNAAMFGVAAALIGAAAIANQNSKAHQQPRQQKTKRHYKKSTKSYKKSTKSHKKATRSSRKKVARKKTIVVTDEMKIQKTLVSLGYYSGTINGDLNSFETRNAVKKLNESYGISNSSSIDEKTKNQLLYIANLYELDKALNTKETSKKAKGKQLQAALKIKETYTGKIDGAIGNGTRKAIATYRINEGMVPNTSLSEEEKFELLSNTMALNSENIKEALAVLDNNQKATVPVKVEAPMTLAENEPMAKNIETPVEVSQAEEKKITLNALEPVKKTVQKEEEDDFAIPDA